MRVTCEETLSVRRRVRRAKLSRSGERWTRLRDDSRGWTYLLSERFPISLLGISRNALLRDIDRCVETARLFLCARSAVSGWLETSEPKFSKPILPSYTLDIVVNLRPFVIFIFRPFGNNRDISFFNFDAKRDSFFFIMRFCKYFGILIIHVYRSIACRRKTWNLDSITPKKAQRRSRKQRTSNYDEKKSEN